MNNTYARAYTEVCEILKYLPEEEYKKIPKEKIEFYESNKDNNYTFQYDSNKTLKEQHISSKTNAIIITIFRDFFATNVQKEKLQKILWQNEQKYQDELKQKYSYENIFNVKKINKGQKQMEIMEESNLVPYNESKFKRIRIWFSKLISKFNRK